MRWRRWRRCHSRCARRFRVQGLTGSDVPRHELYGRIKDAFRRHALPALAALSCSLVYAGFNFRA